MHILKSITVGVLITPAMGNLAQRSCTSGTYRCSKYAPPQFNNATSTIQVCSNSFWLLAASCGAGQICVQDIAGGCTCN
ncbi:hypothetical protein GGR57DRAFT_468124 [Xylariaceae sp. FL1272]|nr:hypothetical protein GGR57DRAFT_468124 [Xylariaceae sp. FL1272]